MHLSSSSSQTVALRNSKTVFSDWKKNSTVLNPRPMSTSHKGSSHWGRFEKLKGIIRQGIVAYFTLQMKEISPFVRAARYVAVRFSTDINSDDGITPQLSMVWFIL